MSENRFYEIADLDIGETIAVYTKRRDAVERILAIYDCYEEAALCHLTSYIVPINREYMRRALEGQSFAHDLKEIEILPEWWER